MKDYDLIIIGSGSAMNLVEPMISLNPKVKIAVIDKDQPGGICLTRGCIPSKILLYPAELVRVIEEAGQFGIDAPVRKVDFGQVMERMRRLIGREIDQIREGLSHSENIDYYHAPAEFIAPYTLQVSGTQIRSKMIFLCIGSQPVIPNVAGLEQAGYLTSDTILGLTQLPESVAVIGAGYIGAELGHFLSCMGSKVTIIGRNPKFLPEEEPEVGELAEKILGRHMKIVVNHVVMEVRKLPNGRKQVVTVDMKTRETLSVETAEILVAAGRGPTTGILHPERGGIKLTEKGWVRVDDYLETSQSNVWAFGDADGRYMFKHVANYESIVVFNNAVLKKKVKVDYHAVPHAVFTYPEVASVGLTEEEAIEQYGIEKIAIGFQRYEDTAKGEAIEARDYFVKAIIETETDKVLGCHIIGPQASVLIHEVIPVMYTPDGTFHPIRDMMHIHPALSEVVDRAFNQSLMTPEHYHHHREMGREVVEPQTADTM